MSWRSQPVQGGLLRFDRERGLNVLTRSAATRDLMREAPRSLQVGLLTPCNLACEFCYRDTTAPSKLTAPFLIDLLQRADAWGVLEVAFGGGEPLLFKGFDDLLRELHATTGLGLNFTTNGTQLTDARWAQLREYVGEVRVSAYPDNHYRATLRRLRGETVGVNWLVTPQNVALVEPFVHDALAVGATNVLLLGYKGGDLSLRLTRADLATLEAAVRRMRGLPIRLDICWYPHLEAVEHLFARADCGAGTEFLVITPDQAMQPCSFHHERIPFADFDELRAIWADLAARRSAARVGGCTRSDFVPVTELRPSAPEQFVWHARAGNNSGAWTIVARFCSDEEASSAAAALRELSRAHEIFLASSEGQAFLEANDYDGSIPTPPLRAFGEAHGFDWSQDGDGLWWEEDGCGAPVLTAGALGDTVVVYHPYCMGLPEEPLARFFRRVGAEHFGYFDGGVPRLVVEAKGDTDVVRRELEEFLARVSAARYPEDAGEPPWGSRVDDPRVPDDEDQSTELLDDKPKVDLRRGSVRLELQLANTFAGSVAIQAWLRRCGFTDISIAVASRLEPVTPVAPKIEPKTGLFGDVRPLAERAAELPDGELLELVFQSAHPMPSLEGRLRSIDADNFCTSALAAAEARWSRGVDVTYVLSWLLRLRGTDAAPLARAAKGRLLASPWVSSAFKGLAEALPESESFAIAEDWVRSASSWARAGERLMRLAVLANPRVLGLIEAYWDDADERLKPDSTWGALAHDSLLSWAEARSWLEGGPPHCRIALFALVHHAGIGVPERFAGPDEATLRSVLDEYPRPRTPHERRALAELAGNLEPLTR